MYSNYYDYPTTGLSSQSAGDYSLEFLLGFYAIYFIIYFAIIAFYIISRWLFFRKCGEGGWKAIIPVYNELTLLKISGLSWIWIFFLYAPYIVMVFVYFLLFMFAGLDSLYSYSDISFAGGSILFTWIGILLILVALAAIIITRISIGLNITKKFRRSGGYTPLFVLSYSEPIMYLIFALSSSFKYDSSVKVPKFGIFGPHSNN